MKIRCDACGAYFKTEDNIVCPYCGTNYGNDAELSVQLSHEEELRKLELEKAKLSVEKEQVLIDYEHEKARYRNKTQNENKKAGCLVKVIILIILSPFLAFIAFGILSAVLGVIFDSAVEYTENKQEIESSYNDSEYTKDGYRWNEDEKNESEKEPTYVTAYIGTPAENEKYRIEIMEMTVVPDSNKYPFGNFVETGHRVVQIKLRVKNNSMEDVMFNDAIYLFADELLCPSAGWLQVAQEPKRIEGLFIPSGASVEGWTLWQVPEGTENFRLVVGEYIQFDASEYKLEVGEQ